VTRTDKVFLGLAVMLAVVMILLGLAVNAEAHRLSGNPKTLRGKLELAKRQVAHDRRMMAPPATKRWLLLYPLPGRVLVHKVWLRRDVRHMRRLERRLDAVTLGPSWLVRAFLCIHSHEGAWNDSGDPYWGGLQMDRGFMATYGAWAIRRYGGFANVWPPAVRIQVAIAAYRTRGFYPWPSTARACGLL